MKAEKERSKRFQMVINDDLKYRATKIAKRKTLSLAGYISSTLAAQVEHDERQQAAA